MFTYSDGFDALCGFSFATCPPLADRRCFASHFHLFFLSFLLSFLRSYCSSIKLPKKVRVRRRVGLAVPSIAGGLSPPGPQSGLVLKEGDVCQECGRYSPAVGIVKQVNTAKQ